MANSSSPVRILHLIKSLGRGGAEMLLPETIRVHHREKFTFHCLYFLPWKNQMVDALEQNGVAVTCLKANNNVQMMLRIPAIIRYCRQHNIQLIHCHLPWAGFAGRIIYKLTGIPVVYTEHNKQERYNRVTKILNKLTFNWQRSAIAVSNDVAESIQQHIHPRVPVQTILNGVNTERFQRQAAAGADIRARYNIPADAVVIGTLAVFRFQKRLAEWLEVMKALTDKYPQVVGIVVGDGPLKQELADKRQALGLEQKVLMPGLQTNTVDWFSAMDIFMMSSIFEGLPIALLEAMSCGCAIATTDAGGIKEVIRHQTDGLLVSTQQWQGLEEACSQYIEQAEMRHHFGEAARARVQQSFSMHTMVEQLETLYEHTLSGS